MFHFFTHTNTMSVSNTYLTTWHGTYNVKTLSLMKCHILSPIVCVLCFGTGFNSIVRLRMFYQLEFFDGGFGVLIFMLTFLTETVN